MTLIFVWYLLLAPTDRVLCSMWTVHQPTSAEINEACGNLPPQTDFIVRVRHIDTGEIRCERPGTAITDIPSACAIGPWIDYYMIEIVQHVTERLNCAIEITHAGQPNAAEIAEACGPLPGAYRLQYIQTIEPEPARPLCALPPTPPSGPGLLDQPASAAALATDDPLDLLAYRLAWYSITDTPAHWQNRYDAEIYAAAIAWNVPSRLLKRLARDESQFWIWDGSDGEIGLVQLTDNGLDTLARCRLPGYDRMDGKAKQAARAEIRSGLECNYCSPWQAAEKERTNWHTYAEALAAYYAHYGDWTAALAGWNIRHEGILQ